jgi:hypothetical protein
MVHKSHGDVKIATIPTVPRESISSEIDIWIDQLKVIQSTLADSISVNGMMLKLSSDVVLCLLACRRSDAVDVIVSLKGIRTASSNPCLQTPLNAANDFCGSKVRPCADKKQATRRRGEAMFQNSKT